MQFDAFFELCRIYSAWAEASRAELVAEPWRGAYFKGRPVWKHHVKRDSEGHVINHKTFSATFSLPRQIAGVASFQSIDPEFGQDQFRRVPRTGDVIQILGPLVGTWIQQVGDLGKVRWKFRTGIYRPEGDQLQMGLTPVWLDHNPPDGDLSKLDYNRVPVLPAFANHEGMELTEAQRAALANPARYRQVLDATGELHRKLLAEHELYLQQQQQGEEAA
eukprot:jgi/Tetstr1/433439/TSEL_022713.t1